MKADTAFSLENLIAWLETQPADEPYDWSKPCECLIGQWLRSMRVTNVRGKSNRIALSDPFYDIAVNSFDRVYTFGAALERARAALSPPDLGGQL